MNNQDLELKLLRGSPIEVKGIGLLHPLTLDEISQIGELKYNQYISVLTFNQDPITIEGNLITKFETLLVYCISDETFRNVFMDALKAFFKEEAHLNESGFFYFGELEEKRIIHKGNFDEIHTSIKSIIRQQNFIKDVEEDEYRPANDKVAEFVAKMKQIKEKVKQQNKEDGLNLSDIISIVSAYSYNLNIKSVWELTVYQLYSLYIRLMMKDNYEAQFQLMLQGADIKSEDMKHWAAKLNK